MKLRSAVAGAASGAVVTAAIWMLLEDLWDGIGRAAGALFSLSLGGPAQPPPPHRYDWACYGALVGLAAGTALGLCARLTGRDVGGWFVGALTAAASWAVSAAVVLYAVGSDLLDEGLIPPAATSFAACVLLGALVGASTDFLFRRLGRRAQESSAL